MPKNEKNFDTSKKASEGILIGILKAYLRQVLLNTKRLKKSC